MHKLCTCPKACQHVVQECVRGALSSFLHNGDCFHVFAEVFYAHHDVLVAPWCLGQGSCQVHPPAVPQPFDWQGLKVCWFSSAKAGLDPAALFAATHQVCNISLQSVPPVCVEHQVGCAPDTKVSAAVVQLEWLQELLVAQGYTGKLNVVSMGVYEEV
jgi:hypothetical protein